MRRIGLVILMLLIMTGFAYAKGFEVSKQAGPYAVTVTLDKNPPVTGDNAVTIAVKEAGKAVAVAQVAIDYGMPAKISRGGKTQNVKLNIDVR